VLRFPGILTNAEFAELQAKLNRNPLRRGARTSSPALLTGVAYCAICGKVMHRRPSMTTRTTDSPAGKAGSKNVIWYYRCDGDQRQPSKCKNMIPLTELDRAVALQIRLAADRPYRIPVKVPGHDWQPDIDEVIAEMRAMSLDEPDYLARQAELYAEMQRLQALAPVGETVTEKDTGETIGEHWASLAPAGQRNWLLDNGVRAMVRKVAKGNYEVKLTGMPI